MAEAQGNYSYVPLSIPGAPGPKVYIFIFNRKILFLESIIIHRVLWELKVNLVILVILVPLVLLDLRV
jgi:hypothetical protein